MERTGEGDGGGARGRTVEVKGEGGSGNSGRMTGRADQVGIGSRALPKPALSKSACPVRILIRKMKNG